MGVRGFHVWSVGVYYSARVLGVFVTSGLVMPTFTDGTFVRQGDLNTLATGISDISTVLTGAGAPRNYVPALYASITSSHSIPRNVDTVITFDAASINNDGMWTSGQSALTIQTGGIYIAAAQAHLAPNTGTAIACHIQLNGTSVFNAVAACATQGINSGEGNAMVAVSPPLILPPGSTLYISVFQNTSGSVNVTTTNSGTFISIVRIGNQT